MLGEALNIAVVVILAVAFLWMLAKTPKQLRRALQLLRPRAPGDRQLRSGTVAAVRGRVVPIDLLISPYSENKGVYLKYRTERWEDQGGNSLSAGRWAPGEAEEEAAPFELVSDSGSVLVDPEGAEFYSKTATSELELGPIGRIRLSEGVVRPDDIVLARGTLEEKAATAGYRGTSKRMELVAGQSGLVVGPASVIRRELLLGLGFRALLLALLLLGNLVAISWWGNHHPTVRLELPDHPGPGYDVSQVPEVFLRLDRFGDRVPGNARPVGTATLEIRVLGFSFDHAPWSWVSNHRPWQSVRAEARRAFAQRSLDGLQNVEVEHRRELLIYSVTRISGTAYHDPRRWTNVRERAYISHPATRAPAEEIRFENDESEETAPTE